jgi:hypothetical protein
VKAVTDQAIAEQEAQLDRLEPQLQQHAQEQQAARNAPPPPPPGFVPEADAQQVLDNFTAKSPAFGKAMDQQHEQRTLAQENQEADATAFQRKVDSLQPGAVPQSAEEPRPAMLAANRGALTRAVNETVNNPPPPPPGFVPETDSLSPPPAQPSPPAAPSRPRRRAQHGRRGEEPARHVGSILPHQRRSRRSARRGRAGRRVRGQPQQRHDRRPGVLRADSRGWAGAVRAQAAPAARPAHARRRVRRAERKRVSTPRRRRIRSRSSSRSTARLTTSTSSAPTRSAPARGRRRTGTGCTSRERRASRIITKGN